MPATECLEPNNLGEVTLEHDWVLYIAAFSTAFAISNVMTPVAKKISLKLGAIDMPKARGMHKKPMPRMGGIAIVAGFTLTVLLLYNFTEYSDMHKLTGYFIGAAMIVVLEWLTMLKTFQLSLSLRFKFWRRLWQWPLAYGYILLCGRFTYALLKLSIPITVIWIVGLTNAVNLIDGLDGLATGVSSIAAICIMVLCILTGDETSVVLTAALAGSCLGFLPRNFNPAEIFMGDTGATFLGYTLAVTSILGVFKGYAMIALMVSDAAL